MNAVIELEYLSTNHNLSYGTTSESSRKDKHSPKRS